MRAVYGLLLLVCSLAQAEINYDLTPTSLQAQIEKQGAKPLLEALFADHTAMNIVLLSMDSGSPEWLALAKVFAEVAEGQNRAMIGMAVGEALQWQPAAVLAWQQDLFPLPKLCGLQGLYEWRTMSRQLALVALQRREAAVTLVDDQALRAKRALCLMSLAQAKDQALKLLNNRP
ncbi:MAG: hypothetical protein Q9N68_03455 [Gammaproteobacteria bacterium]|nr:hypothetical protein [Gammaproteobacteria bacterium]